MPNRKLVIRQANILKSIGGGRIKQKTLKDTVKSKLVNNHNIKENQFNFRIRSLHWQFEFTISDAKNLLKVFK